MKSRFTAILHQEEGEYVAFTPNLDIASQGATQEEALANLKEAVELFLESASAEEIAFRSSSNNETWITHFEAEHATA